MIKQVRFITRAKVAKDMPCLGNVEIKIPLQHMQSFLFLGAKTSFGKAGGKQVCRGRFQY